MTGAAPDRSQRIKVRKNFSRVDVNVNARRFFDPQLPIPTRKRK
jgi:hypothetical protein